MNSDSWAILSSIEQSIKNKIESKGIPLKDWDIQINRGILTGFNEAFIISTEKKDELIAVDPKSAELIRPILRGRDIKRYSYNFAGLWVIIAKYGSYKYLESEYPAIYKHLNSYKEQLQKRGQCRYTSSGKIHTDRPFPGQHHWLELDNNPRDEYLNDFFKQKIIFQEMIQEPSFVLDNDNNFFCLDTGRIITGENLEYLLGLMNSKLFFYAVKNFYGGGALGEKAIRMKHTFFGHFPAVIPSHEELAYIQKLYYTVPMEEFDKYIVESLYKQYKFSQDEIKLIENILS